MIPAREMLWLPWPFGSAYTVMVITPKVPTPMRSPRFSTNTGRAILSEEEKKLRGRSGEENSFYGKKHTDESKILQGIGNKGRIKSPEEISNWIEKVAKLPMTEEHKLIVSIANKDKIMLKNFDTGEVLKVDRLDLDLYDVNIWKNPATIQKRASCEHCGITSTVGNIVRWHNDNCKERKYENN